MARGLQNKRWVMYSSKAFRNIFGSSYFVSGSDRDKYDTILSDIVNIIR